MAPARERRDEPELDDLVGERGGDDAAADRQDVGVVVLARHPRTIQVVAEGGANPVDLVGRDLFPLAAPADDDAAIRLAVRDQPRDLGADRRIVDRRFRIRSAIVHVVAEAGERAEEVLLQREPGVIRSDRDALGYGIIR